MLSDTLLKLTKQFYPTGRAFKMFDGGYLEAFHIAVNKSEERAYNAAIAIHNSILPDNANFSTDDATDWERRLGLITNSLVSLPDRMLAIKRKLNYPGLNPAKGHFQHLEYQLQLAGFDVYVYENRFPDYPTGYYTQTPFEITGNSGLFTTVRHGPIQHGQVKHGVVYNNKIANHIDESLDLNFDIGSSYRSTFFIGGNPLGTFANVDVNRKDEFRQLILKIKFVQDIGFLFINYV